MAKNRLIAPFLKWVGGKRQLLPVIVQHLPKDISNYQYIEPFIGGGAVLFNLQPKKAMINDINVELINVFEVIKDDVENLIEDLKKHRNDPDYFYKIRGIDRTDEFTKLTKIEKASRIIYLNKTCFNGLYRVNNAGEFNAPFGRYQNPNIVNEPTLRAVNRYLNANDIKIFNGDYEDVLSEADTNSFIYIDPPYFPISAGSNFTGYVKGGWNMWDQIRLREACDKLNSKGVKFLLSNSGSDFIRNQYKDYHIITVKAIRSINSDGEKRGEVDELLIRNYE